MKHPRDRAERRDVRDRVIARRKRIMQHIWRMRTAPIFTINRETPVAPLFEEFPEWGRYSKWNLNCTCWMCHYEKRTEKRKRRRQLDAALLDHIRSWE